MADKELVTRVWIEPGCIVCDACETTSPEVFEVQEENCVIRPDALQPDFTRPRTQEIKDAAEECPVDVIKFETVTQDVGDEAAPASVVATAEGRPAALASAADPSDPAPVKSLQAPAVAGDVEPAAAKMAASAKTVPTQEPDAAVAALLRAATSRGGNAGIRRKDGQVPHAVQAWQNKKPADLPPDARQARILEAARKTRQDPDKRRRDLMSDTALAVGWVAFGGGLGVSVGPALARFMMPNVLEEPDPRVRVGEFLHYLEMAPGDVDETYKPQGIWMIRDGERIVALNIICTHLGCIPNWLPNDQKFKCPCHGSGYTPSGINFEGPTPRPLERFRVYTEDGIVIVDKSKKYQYELGQWDQPGSYLEV